MNLYLVCNTEMGSTLYECMRREDLSPPSIHSGQGCSVWTIHHLNRSQVILLCWQKKLFPGESLENFSSMYCALLRVCLRVFLTRVRFHKLKYSTKLIRK